MGFSTIMSPSSASNRFSALIACFLVASCGGGGGGSSTPPPPPPPPAAPSGLAYTTPQTYTVNTAVTALNPTVTGTVTTYTVSPALPAGLAISATSGAISGTPTAITAQANYVVTAANAGGSTTATVSITVNDVAPDVTYPQSTYAFTTGIPVPNITPAVTGGAALNYSVNPALPAGLALNASTGVISGTPTAVAASAGYTVTATNSGGNDTVALTLTVRSGVLLDLGNNRAISSVQYVGNRLMTTGFQGDVVLRDAQSGAVLRRTSSNCSVTCEELALLAGTTLAVRKADGFDLYSATDGALLAQIASPSSNTRWALASDGSYVVSQGFQRLMAWSTNGTLLFSIDGNYYDSNVFAAPGEIRAANGAGNTQRVQNIAVPAGTAALGPLFTGTFDGWFDDGERFFTRAGSTLRVFSRQSVELDSATLASSVRVAGSGNWYHSTNGNLSIWTVGSAGVASATYTVGSLGRIQGTGNTLAIIPYQIPSISVIDLSGASPVKTDYVTPVAALTLFAGLSASEWIFTSTGGAMFGELGAGAPQIYSHGDVRGIVGSTSRVVIAFASGKIRHYAADTQAFEGELDLAVDKIELSADGTVLAASADDGQAQYVTDRTLRVFSLPSHNLLAQWPYTFGSGAQPVDFALSRDGQVVAQYLSDPSTGRILRANELDGTPLLDQLVPSFINLTATPRLAVSDSGSGVAYPETPIGDGNATGLYVNGTRSGAAVGWASGWLDDSRLIVNRFRGIPDEFAFVGADIVSSSGTLLAQPALPNMSRFQLVGTDTIYSPELNVILNATTGDTVWSSAAPISNNRSQNVGAVAGNYVYFVSGTTIRVEPR